MTSTFDPALITCTCGLWPRSSLEFTVKRKPSTSSVGTVLIIPTQCRFCQGTLPLTKQLITWTGDRFDGKASRVPAEHRATLPPPQVSPCGRRTIPPEHHAGRLRPRLRQFSWQIQLFAPASVRTITILEMILMIQGRPRVCHGLIEPSRRGAFEGLDAFR